MLGDGCYMYSCLLPDPLSSEEAWMHARDLGKLRHCDSSSFVWVWIKPHADKASWLLLLLPRKIVHLSTYGGLHVSRRRQHSTSPMSMAAITPVASQAANKHLR